MIGLVAPTLLGAAVQLSDDRIVLYFAVRRRSVEQEEDIEEIVGDFGGFLLPEKPPLDVEIYEGAPDLRWPGFSARNVCRAKQ